jgi:hypothetical protein
VSTAVHAAPPARQRDPADRRRVVVSIVIEEALRQVTPILAPMVADWQQLTAATPVIEAVVSLVALAISRPSWHR